MRSLSQRASSVSESLVQSPRAEHCTGQLPSLFSGSYVLERKVRRRWACKKVNNENTRLTVNRLHQTEVQEMLYHSDNARLMAVNRQVKEHHVEGRQRLLFKIGRLGKPLPKRRLCLDLITERTNHEKISRETFWAQGASLAC